MLPEPLILGILTFQLLYAAVQWYFFRRKEYLFYALYSVIIGTYFFLQYQLVDHYLTIGYLKVHDSILNSSIVYLALFFYIGFGRLFVNAPGIAPQLDKWIKWVTRAMLAYAILTAFWFISTEIQMPVRVIHLFISLSFFAFYVFALYRVFMTKSVLAKFLVTGSLLMGTGAVGAMIYRLWNPEVLSEKISSLLFLQVGVILELICLNIGLIYKSKQILDTNTRSGLLISKQLEKNEKQLSDLNAVRDEISHELKIELGDGLSGIKLMSDMIQQKMGDHHIKELERISENSEKLVQSMNEIVWSLNNLNDDLPGLISYIREYAMSFMDQVGSDCCLSEPEHIPNISISGDTRRHIFLAVKEALHNAVKHSGSNSITISFSITDTLLITIADNGKGMAENSTFNGGNGLRNMKKRMGFLKGTLKIIDEKGVTIVFEVPLQQMTQ